MGLLIHHTAASFWYGCKQDEAADVLAAHCAKWGRATVVRAEYVVKWDGDRVAESVPVELEYK